MQEKITAARDISPLPSFQGPALVTRQDAPAFSQLLTAQLGGEEAPALTPGNGGELAPPYLFGTLAFTTPVGQSIGSTATNSFLDPQSRGANPRYTMGSPFIPRWHLTHSLLADKSGFHAPWRYFDWKGFPAQSSTDEDGAFSGGLDQPAISHYVGGRFRSLAYTGAPQAVGQGIEQFHFAHMMEKDGTIFAYFIDHSGGSQNDVGLATSQDGVNFEYRGKVLTKGESFDALQASFPSVQYDAQSRRWYMLYEGKSADDDVNSVCLAVSTDGVNWEKKGPVITPHDAGEISNIDVGTPTMFKENGVWHVYFHTFASDGRVRNGYASGTELDNLSVRDGALLDVDRSGIEGGTVGARSNVVKMGGYYYMAYEVCSPMKQFGEARWGTNLARAESPGGPWRKMDKPLLTNERQGFGFDGPELLIQDGKLYMYYRHGGNATSRVEIKGLTGGEGSPPLSMAHDAAAG